MMPSEPMRRLIWESMLEADIRARYFGYRASRFERRERVLRVILLVVSSAQFLILISQLQVPLVAEIVAGVVVLLSVFLTTFAYSSSAKLNAALHRVHSELATEYELLWVGVDTNDDKALEKKHRELQEKPRGLVEEASRETVDSKLVDRCCADVMAARRLESPA
jgi:hypothetical protein